MNSEYTQSLPGLSLIVLAYNEEASVVAYLDECLGYLDTLSGNHEIILVDDGSSDRTRELALEVAQRDGRIKVISHDSNRGMGSGMRTGIQTSSKDYFTILAADGQGSPYELNKLLPRLRDAQIVLSIYRLRGDGVHRKVLSYGLRAMMRLVLQTTFQLEGIYLFPTKIAIEEIGLDKIKSDTFFFSFELITNAIELGHSIKTVAIEVRKRQKGTSKVANLNRILKVGGEVLRFRVRRTLEQS
jgi:glycosyltransferase involved in cell wall biosynthesis